MGGHLRRSSRAIEYWEKVANFMNPISSIGVEDQSLNIINLSYEHLPICLKPCFLYMGIYSEDIEIGVSELLMFWVSEGYVRPNKSLSLEEVAEDYLKDLIDRNLILVRERRWNGKADVCVIHDVVRELCLKVAKKEKFLSMLEDTTHDIGKERRIVISEGMFDSHMVGALKSAPLLRSLICQGMGHIGRLFVELRLLRVSVYVKNVMLKNECRNILDPNFQQVNLRHLTMSASKIFMVRKRWRVYIPSSISLLWSMQTLILDNLALQLILPHEIWEMPQLGHLQFLEKCLLPDPLSGEECIILRNLRTLLRVQNLRLTEELCKRMPNLKELKVAYDDDSLIGSREASSCYCLHNLVRFNKLESLDCCFSYDPKWRDAVRSFIFPSSLEKLCLWDCHLYWKDLTMMIKSLPHPGSLTLSLVRGPEWDLVDQEFPCRKVLRVLSCYDLIHWKANNFHFPVLEILYLWCIPKLSEIPIDVGDIPTLRLIELQECNISTAVSAMRIVVEQESLRKWELWPSVGCLFFGNGQI